MPLPIPPDPSRLDPLLTSLASGTTLLRVHRTDRDPIGFNPGHGRAGRFHPIPDVPTMYAASTVTGALSETVFHDVPYRGPAKRVLVSRLAGLSMSVIVLRVPVELVLLAGAGLRRLGIRRRDLIDTGPGAYGDTCRWAEALHGARAEPAGLTWMARQDDSSRAYVFFGDRIGTDGFGVLPATVRLDSGIGFALVEQAASDAGIAVVR